MTGIKAASSYSRLDLERAFNRQRIQLLDSRAENRALKIRSKNAILDTAKCASLTSIITSMAKCVSRRRYKAANEIACMALEDE